MSNRKYRNIVINSHTKCYYFDNCDCCSTPIELGCMGLGALTLENSRRSRVLCNDKTGFVNISSPDVITTGGTVTAAAQVFDTLVDSPLHLLFQRQSPITLYIEQWSDCGNNLKSYIILENCFVVEWNLGTLKARTNDEVRPTVENITLQFDKMITGVVPVLDLENINGPVLRLGSSNNNENPYCICSSDWLMTYECGFYNIFNHEGDFLGAHPGPVEVDELVKDGMKGVDGYINPSLIGASPYIYCTDFKPEQTITINNKIYILHEGKVYEHLINSGLHKEIFFGFPINRIDTDNCYLFAINECGFYRYDVIRGNVIELVNQENIQSVNFYIWTDCDKINLDGCNSISYNGSVVPWMFNKYEGIYINNENMPSYTHNGGYTWTTIGPFVQDIYKILDVSKNSKGKILLGGINILDGCGFILRHR